MPAPEIERTKRLGTSRGPGATQIKTLVNGYDDTHAAYYLDAAAGQAAFTFTPAGGKPVSNPIFVIRGVTSAAAPSIVVGGAARTINTGAADSGAFVSYRSPEGELWITLNGTFTSATTVSVGP